MCQPALTFLKKDKRERKREVLKGTVDGVGSEVSGIKWPVGIDVHSADSCVDWNDYDCIQDVHYLLTSHAVHRVRQEFTWLQFPLYRVFLLIDQVGFLNNFSLI